MSTDVLNSKMDGRSFFEMGVRSLPHDAKFDYIVVPLDPEARRGPVWRVVLTPIGLSRPHIPLEICGDTVLGLEGGYTDVDLSGWDARSYGVSRKHIKLRPSTTKLFLVDVGSTNGTHVNGLKLGRSWAYALRDDDIITLGRLHMRIKVMQRPK